jgi:hypothetical protein
MIAGFFICPTAIILIAGAPKLYHIILARVKGLGENTTKNIFFFVCGF